MTVLITSDWHLNDTPRDAYRHDFQKHLRAIAKKAKVQGILMLGDICEEKDRHGAWLVNEVVDHLVKLAEIAPVYLLRGNHDYLNPEEPFFAMLGRIEGLTWVNHPTPSASLPSGPLDELGDILFLPHTRDHNKEWAGLNFKNFDWVFAHNTFQGAVGDNGSLLDGIPVEVFPKDAHVISGDIHSPQTIGPVTYVGSPYRVDFGDSFDPILLLIRDNKLVEVLLSDLPQKRLVTAANTDHGVALEKPRGLHEGDILKVRVSLKSGDHAKWSEIQAEVRAWGTENGYTIHTIQPVVIDSQVKSSAKRLSRARQDDSSLLQEYGRQRDIDPKTLNVGQSFLKADE